MQSMLPLLKYVRGEVLSPDHWHELFHMLGMPRGTTLEKLTFGDIIKVTDAIIGTLHIETGASLSKVLFTFMLQHYGHILIPYIMNCQHRHKHRAKCRIPMCDRGVGSF